MTVLRKTSLNDTTEIFLLTGLEENIPGIERLLNPFIKLVEEQRRGLTTANISVNMDVQQAAGKRYTVLMQNKDTYMQELDMFKFPIIKLTVPKETLKTIYGTNISQHEF